MQAAPHTSAQRRRPPLHPPAWQQVWARRSPVQQQPRSPKGAERTPAAASPEAREGQLADPVEPREPRRWTPPPADLVGKMKRRLEKSHPAEKICDAGAQPVREVEGAIGLVVPGRVPRSHGSPALGGSRLEDFLKEYSRVFIMSPSVKVQDIKGRQEISDATGARQGPGVKKGSEELLSPAVALPAPLRLGGTGDENSDGDLTLLPSSRPLVSGSVSVAPLCLRWLLERAPNSRPQLCLLRPGNDQILALS
ncbi:hypothetical protein ACSSS7_007700 [Eimeria intestinalis]